MEIETEYAVELFFPSSSFVQVYFEAIANALDASADEISIHIATNRKLTSDSVEIRICDNGVGFTDERYDRFKRLKKPSDAYHKGLGRLVYLCYFAQVDVTSIYDGKKRIFKFSRKFRGDEAKPAMASEADRPGTMLHFHHFSGQRLKSQETLRPESLKELIIEQFLPRLHDLKKAEKNFTIKIELDTGEQVFGQPYANSATITPHDIPQFETKTIKDPALNLYDTIEMYYILPEGNGGRLLTAVCVDGRTIPRSLLKPTALPGNRSAIFLFESKLFGGKSDSTRQRLILPENITDQTLDRVLRHEISKILNRRVPEICARNADTQKHFEERYPHLTGLFDEQTVGIIDKVEAIKAAQDRFFETQRAVLESTSLDDATYHKSLEISSRTLAEYILYRQFIIDQLAKTTAIDAEEGLHNLLVPRRQVFDNHMLFNGIYNNNAWLLDDKFMTFRTILSEQRMQDVISAITLRDGLVKDSGRPDIAMVFSADPMQQEKVDVVVVELKKRVVDAKENFYAITQLSERAQKLLDYCPNIQRVWYFAIVEIDAEFARLMQTNNWAPLFSKGTVFYQEFKVHRIDGSVAPSPFYVLSYDAVIKDASARNHTFLEILRGAFKKAVPVPASEDDAAT